MAKAKETKVNLSHKEFSNKQEPSFRVSTGWGIIFLNSINNLFSRVTRGPQWFQWAGKVALHINPVQTYDWFADILWPLVDCVKRGLSILLRSLIPKDQRLVQWVDFKQSLELSLSGWLEEAEQVEDACSSVRALCSHPQGSSG